MFRDYHDYIINSYFDYKYYYDDKLSGFVISK